MNYNAIIFDCDGVILDSNLMKILAFIDSLNEYPTSVVKKFSHYQSQNFGRSRYLLFQDFFSLFLKREPLSGEIDKLLKYYADIVEKKYLEAPTTIGCLETLEYLYTKYSLFVVSGSDEQELNNVFRSRGLDKYFIKIYGSPKAKEENIRIIIKEHKYEKCLYIGDAYNDYECVSKVDECDFLYMKDYSTSKEMMESVINNTNVKVINNLTELKKEI